MTEFSDFRACHHTQTQACSWPAGSQPREDTLGPILESGPANLLALLLPAALSL